MAIIFGIPDYSVEKEAEKIFDKISKPFSNYGVGLTDVDEKYMRWKFNDKMVSIVCFIDLPSRKIAEELKKLLKENGLVSLLNDPLEKETDDCKKLFVRSLQEIEKNSDFYPEGN